MGHAQMRAAIAFASWMVASTSPAVEFDLIAWNVESGGAQRATISQQLGEYEDVDLWVLSEVQPGDAQFYIESTEIGEPGDFSGLIGSTGSADRLVISFDEEQFEFVEGYELIDLAMGGGRAPLVAHLRVREDGSEFLLVANHLYRGDAQKRLAQAIGLRDWAQGETLPILTAGDFNMDYDLPNGPGNEAFVEFGLGGIYRWERPASLVETNWSDNNSDGENDYHSVLDFVWTAGPAQQWNVESDIVVIDGDFPDNGQTSDHRPVLAHINTSTVGPRTTAAAVTQPKLRLAQPRHSPRSLSSSVSQGRPSSEVRNVLSEAVQRERIASSGIGERGSQAFGHFEGRVVGSWDDDGRNMELLEDFAYVDSKGRKWLARSGSMVNGASIPQPFWTIIGSPYTGKYRKASVVHDVACEEKSGTWRDVHRMFYEACRCGGVNAAQAKVMYWAVYHGGPRWGERDAVRASTAPLSPEELKAVEAYVKWRDPPLEELEALPPSSVITP